MARIVPGIAAFTGGMLFLAPAAPVAEAQTPTRAFEIAAGVQYGVCQATSKTDPLATSKTAPPKKRRMYTDRQR